jgi:hypothetical protein
MLTNGQDLSQLFSLPTFANTASAFTQPGPFSANTAPPELSFFQNGVTNGPVNSLGTQAPFGTPNNGILTPRIQIGFAPQPIPGANVRNQLPPWLTGAQSVPV